VRLRQAVGGFGKLRDRDRWLRPDGMDGKQQSQQDQDSHAAMSFLFIPG
jgi:hypothetical protein